MMTEPPPSPVFGPFLMSLAARLRIVARSAHRPLLGLMLLAGPALLAESEASAPGEAGPKVRAAFKKLLAAPRRTTFTEHGAGDWRERWMLDGLKGEVRPHAKGLYYQAGPIADDHASHAVLWTRASSRGFLRVKFDYTRMDTVNRGENILYLPATGTGEGPYAEDIATWAERRDLPRYQDRRTDHLIQVTWPTISDARDGVPPGSRGIPPGTNQTVLNAATLARTRI